MAQWRGAGACRRLRRSCAAVHCAADLPGQALRSGPHAGPEPAGPDSSMPERRLLGRAFLLGQRVSLSLRYGSDTLEGGKTRTGRVLGVQQIRKTGAPKHRQRFLSVRSKHSKYTRGKHSSSQSHQHALNSLSTLTFAHSRGLLRSFVSFRFVRGGVRERQSNFSAGSALRVRRLRRGRALSGRVFRRQ